MQRSIASVTVSVGVRDGPLLPLTQEAGRCGAARKSRHTLRLQKLIRAEVVAAARSCHSLNV